ncbi:hypothetical protein F4Z98_15660 [Candidatus Poribacteria bacterium]|nr:hypothetical protein [Candidatus Poribacteria bacterium]MYB01733.1 hypothetical protein [Candidatus Poribacteria bacterium]
MRLFEKCMVLFAMPLIFFTVGCGGENNEETLDSPIAPGNIDRGSGGLSSGDWDDLTQLEKNRKILARAIEDIGVMVRQTCKVWIQHVVLDVTNGYWLPQNDVANSDRWIEDRNNRVFGWGAGFNSSTDITLADPGAIVQIRWVEGYASPVFEENLHTAIILYVTKNHIVFIDSNFDDTPTGDDAYVRIRVTTVSDFHRYVESFTVYYVR